jgi:hypothetical protein
MAIEIVSFPIKNDGSFHSYVSLPEGNSSVLITHDSWINDWIHYLSLFGCCHHSLYEHISFINTMVIHDSQTVTIIYDHVLLLFMYQYIYITILYYDYYYSYIYDHILPLLLFIWIASVKVCISHVSTTSRCWDPDPRRPQSRSASLFEPLKQRGMVDPMKLIQICNVKYG